MVSYSFCDENARTADAVIESSFLVAPAEEQQRHLIQSYIVNTGNAATLQQVCAICARLLGIKALRQVTVKDIPNLALLSPTESHPSHHLTEGALLYCNDTGHVPNFAWIECLTLLEKANLPITCGSERYRSV